jgi:hypothetical protein
LTVTDDSDATASDTVTVTVSTATTNELHVQDQVVTRAKERGRERGVDTVLITDEKNRPVDGATVSAAYTGPNEGTVSGITGADGTVVLRTPWIRKAKPSWCFEILDVAKDGWTYNAAANVVTIQCENK